MIKFVVPAMPWISPKTGKERQIIDGFYVMGRRPNKARLERYVAWKVRAQHCARRAGLELPLRPTKLNPLYVVTIAHFQSSVHSDPENVHKGIVDALCYVGKEEQKLLRIKKGSDKYTGGLFFAPQYNEEHPRVEVTILAAEEFEGMTTDYYLAVIDRLIKEEL